MFKWKSLFKKEVKREPKKKVDIRELVRNQLNIVHDVIDLEELKERDIPKYKDFLARAHDIYESDVFNTVLNNLITEQKDAITRECVTLEQLWCGRASLIGIDQVRNEFNRLEMMYQEENKKEEEINKNDIL